MDPTFSSRKNSVNLFMAVYVAPREVRVYMRTHDSNRVNVYKNLTCKRIWRQRRMLRNKASSKKVNSAL